MEAFQDKKNAVNFRVIKMKQGDDNCFICAGINEREVDPSNKQKICGITKFSPQGQSASTKNRDYICEKFEKSKYFKGI